MRLLLLLALAAAPLPTLDAEEYAVISAAIARVAKADEPLVVLERIPAIAHPEEEAGLAEDAQADMETKTVASFVERNRAGGHVEAKLGQNVSVLSEERRRALWKGAGCEEGWKRLRAEFPGMRGLVEVSRVGVNHDHTQALVFVSRQDGCAEGRGDLFELEKSHGAWQVVAIVSVWGL